MFFGDCGLAAKVGGCEALGFDGKVAMLEGSGPNTNSEGLSLSGFAGLGGNVGNSRGVTASGAYRRRELAGARSMNFACVLSAESITSMTGSRSTRLSFEVVGGTCGLAIFGCAGWGDVGAVVFDVRSSAVF